MHWVGTNSFSGSFLWGIHRYSYSFSFIYIINIYLLFKNIGTAIETVDTSSWGEIQRQARFMYSLQFSREEQIMTNDNLKHYIML
jgi:uncharacterized membrane protein